MEKVGTKPVKRANFCKIFKENVIYYSRILFPFLVKNCCYGKSLYIFHVLYHHFTIHHCTIAFILNIIIFMVIQGKCINWVRSTVRLQNYNYLRAGRCFKWIHGPWDISHPSIVSKIIPMKFSGKGWCRRRRISCYPSLVIFT